MYKKSRLRIIALITSVLLLLWIATLSIIYFTTYREVATENRTMMELYAKAYAEHGAPASNGRNLKGPKSRFDVTTFYSVAFMEHGVEITNDGPPLFTDEELVQVAGQMLSNQKGFGIQNDLVYLISEQNAYTLVVMMDNTSIGETMDLLVKYMFLFGGIAVFILLLVAYIISGWIIKPLEENDEKQKQFISDAGHELKTPISTVNANLEILAREIGENTWLANIKYENTRMETIVKQLLDLTKTQMVQKELEPVNLSRVVMASLLPFEAQAFEKEITFLYDIEDNLEIKGDQPQIQMLLSILVDNAFSHVKDQGTIQIVLKKAHNKVILTVENQGTEIPKEEREKIFARFYRSNYARNGEENHYGLGLAIAKNIVLIHKGKIYVECNNGWTQFCVEF